MRGQTSSEYLLVVAAVLVLAVFLVSMLGGANLFGADEENTIDDIDLASMQVGVQSYFASGTSTVFDLRNNFGKPINIETILVNGNICNAGQSFFPVSMYVGDQIRVTCADMNVSSGDPIVNIEFSDIATGIEYFTGVPHNQTNPEVSFSGCWSETPNGNGFHPICSCFDLNYTRTNLTRNYSLQNSIDFSSESCSVFQEGSGWDPIGNCTGSCGGGGDEVPYTGYFYGYGYTIDNLFVYKPSDYGIGLFGTLYDAAGSGRLTGIAVTNVNVTGSQHVGALAGDARGSIVRNGSSSGRVQGYAYTGGLIGYMYPGGLIDNSYSSAEVNASFTVGGLVGYGTNIDNSFTNGTVSFDNYYAGGLAGAAQGFVNNSYSLSDVNGTISSFAAAGLVGFIAAGGINNSYSTGVISSDGGYIGGLVGYGAYQYYENSYTTATLDCTGGYCGGLVGQGNGASYLNVNWTNRTGVPNYCIGDAGSGGSNPAGCTAVNLVVGLDLTSTDCWNTTAVAGFHPICTCFDLNLTRTQLSWNYSLQNDIDFTYGSCTAFRTEPGWEPVGNCTGSCFSTTTAYAGYFNGSGFTINNLYTNQSGISGLFGAIGNGTGVVANLGVVDSNVSGTSYVGALSGFIYGAKITNSYTTGVVNGSTGNSGGLVGILTGGVANITDSYSEVIIAGGGYIGGLLGWSFGDLHISGSYFAGEVRSDGPYVGGLVGWSSATSYFDNSFTTGNVSGTHDVGGIVGQSSTGSFINVSASGVVNASADTVGGLIGDSGLTNTTNSSFTGIIDCSSTWCGGIFGFDPGTDFYESNTWVNRTGDPDSCIGDIAIGAGSNPENCTAI